MNMEPQATAASMTIVNSAEPMQHTNPFLNKSTDWQMLGELELPVGSDIQNIINSRLAEILAPLKLQPDFLSRMLRSLQEAARRAITSTGAVPKIGHIHMLVFALQHPELKEKTWGFFRIERLEGAPEAQNLPNHTIELYLYTET